MSFTPQQSITKSISTLQLVERSSVASVSWQGKVYVFYVKNGGNGIWYTGTDDGSKWWPEVQVKASGHVIGLATNTSPTAVVFKNTLYLFYNGSGNDGTWYTNLSGDTWTGASQVQTSGKPTTFRSSTSPTAAVYQEQLYLFWVDGSNNNITYASTSDGNSWAESKTATTKPIASGTSPYAISFNAILWLFWNQDQDNNRTWYSTYTTTGGWTIPISLTLKTQGSAPANTSPNALVLAENCLLRVFWPGSGKNGLWYTDYCVQKDIWTGQFSMRQDIGGQDVRSDTSASAAMMVDTPFVFWAGNSGDLWFSSGVTYTLDDGDWVSPSQWIRDKKSFSITSPNAELRAYLKSKLGDRWTVLPFPASNTNYKFIRQIFDDYSVQSPLSGADISILSALVTSAITAGYYVQIQIEGQQVASFIYNKAFK